MRRVFALHIVLRWRAGRCRCGAAARRRPRTWRSWRAAGDLSANGRTIEEHWLAPAGGSLMGVSRTVAGGKTVEYEFLQIRDLPEGLTYIAKPSGQAEAQFKIASKTADEIVFENPDARLSAAHPLPPVGADALARADRRDDERQVARHGLSLRAGDCTP